MAQISKTKYSQSDWEDFVHTGPGTLAGRFMRSFWQPICTSAQVEKGRARREQIMSEFVTLYRGDSGEVHAVADRCPHRGTQLSAGWVEGDCIRCFYHGWMFDGAGNCVEQPAEKESFAAKIEIASYPVREYLGLVFVYLGEGKAPEFPRYPELEHEDAGELMTEARVAAPYNYFQRIENNMDQVHVAFVHRDVFGAEGVGEVPQFEVEETDYGMIAYGKRPELPDRLTYFQMPNVAVLLVPPLQGSKTWSPFVVWRVPVDDEHNRSFNVRQVKFEPGYTRDPRLDRDRTQEEITVARDVLEGRKHLDQLDPEDRKLLVPVQDHIAQMGQGTIADRSNDHLGQSDVGVILIRKLWREELRAVADGRPRRLWSWPAGGVVLESGAPPLAAE